MKYTSSITSDATDDSDKVSIDASGVSLVDSADFEIRLLHVWVVATDPLGLTDAKTVTVSVEDVIEKYGDNPLIIQSNLIMQNFPVVRQLQV